MVLRMNLHLGMFLSFLYLLQLFHYATSECPDNTFGMDCSMQCHCPTGDYCNPVNGLCDSQRCHYQWTGASCQIRQPVMRRAPSVIPSIEEPCTFSVWWPAWDEDLDIGAGPIGGYRLEVRVNGQSWTNVAELASDDDKQFYVVAYNVGNDVDIVHRFRIILWRVSSGKMKDSIAGPMSKSAVHSCSKETPPQAVTTTVSTDRPEATTVSTDRPEAPETRTAETTTSPFPLDFEAGPVPLPLPVTLSFDDKNKVKLTPLQSYNKTVMEQPTKSIEMVSVEEDAGELPPGTLYKFEMTSTNASDAMLPVNGTFWTPPFKPPVPLPPDLSKVTNNSIDITIYPLTLNQLRDATPLDSYEIIVEELDLNMSISFESVLDELEFNAEVKNEWLRLISDSRSKRSFPNDVDETYHFNDTTNFYVAMKLPGNETENKTVTIGDGKMYGVYRNFLLKPGTEYNIWFAVSSTLGTSTRRSFTSMPSPVSTLNNTAWFLTSVKLTNEEDSVLLPIILFFVILILIGLGIVIFILWRRKRSKKYFVYTDYPRKKSLTTSFSSQTGCNINNNSGLFSERLYQSCDPLDVIQEASVIHSKPPPPTEEFVIKKSNTIPTKELTKYLEDNIDYSIADEFRSLPTKFIDTVNVASTPENSLKNRSMDVIPYDKNRVKMSKVLADDSSYINASFVKSIDKSVYIATQVPMSTGISDFWRMVWEHDVGNIVMLMSLVEPRKPECQQYWPNMEEPYACGSLIITLINEEVTAHYTIRDLKVLHKTSGKEREVTHFQFESYMRGGLPIHPIPYVDFVRRVQEERDRRFTTLVHCHAGGGRSGVYVAVDSLLAQGKKTLKVDIVKCVSMLRLERPNLVKTFKQYRFVYESLAEAFDHPETRINGERFQFAFDNLLHVQTPQKMSVLGKEYEDLSSHALKRQRTTLTAASTINDSTLFQSPKKRGANVTADRTLQLPVLLEANRKSDDDYQIFDQSLPIFLDVFRKRNGLAIGQHPDSKDQIDAFWTLIIDHNIRCIVDINSEFVASPLPKYCPPENQVFLSGSHKLTLVSQSTNPFESSSMKELSISRLNQVTKSSTHLWNVRLFQWHGWSSDTTVPQVKGMLNLLQAVRNWSEKNPQKTATFILGCHVSRAAMFSLVWMMAERLEDEWLVDIYTSTKYLQHTIPRAVSCFDQYRYLYRVMQEYVQRLQLQSESSTSVIYPATRRASSRASRGLVHKTSSMQHAPTVQDTEQKPKFPPRNVNNNSKALMIKDDDDDGTDDSSSTSPELQPLNPHIYAPVYPGMHALSPIKKN